MGCRHRALVRLSAVCLKDWLESVAVGLDLKRHQLRMLVLSVCFSVHDALRFLLTCIEMWTLDDLADAELLPILA